MNNKGQTIVEVLVALSMAVIIVSAMTTVTLFALNNAQYGRDQNLATKYAQDGMEIVRRIRDTNPLVFQNTFPRQDPYEVDPLTQSFCIGNSDVATFSAQTGEGGDTVNCTATSTCATPHSHHEVDSDGTTTDNNTYSNTNVKCYNAPNVPNPAKFIRYVTLSKYDHACAPNAATIVPVPNVPLPIPAGLVSDVTKATVVVKWSDSKCPSGVTAQYCHSVQEVSCFYNGQ